MFAALGVLAWATPAYAAASTVTIDEKPSKIYYNVPFTIKFTFKNTSGGSASNPHPVVFLNPTPNLPGGQCNPAFRASMAELTQGATPISEHESNPGPTNCHVWWGFDLTHSADPVPNGGTRTYTNVKITARPPSGITTLNLRVAIIKPSAPDVPYATTSVAIPVATLPVPPSPITPTTPAASPTAQPSPSDSPTPTPGDTQTPDPQPSTKPVASTGLGWYWIAAGIALITIGAVVLVLLFRWRSDPEEP